MKIAGPDIILGQKIGQLFGQALGQRGDQSPLSGGHYLADLGHDIPDLAIYGPDLHQRIEQAGGPDDLLYHLSRAFQLEVARCGRDEDRIFHVPFELLKAQRTVVVGAGQAEAIVDQAFLAGSVAIIHGPKLGQGLVALVYYQEEVVGKIVQKAVWRLARQTAVEMTGVVFYALAASRLGDHLQVVQRPLLEPVGLDHSQLRQALFQLGHDGVHSCFLLLLRNDIMPGRIDEEVPQLLFNLPRLPVHLGDAVYLLSEQLNPDDVVEVAGNQIYAVAFDPEAAGCEVDIVSLKKDIHQSGEDLPAGDMIPHMDLKAHLLEVLWIAQSIDAGDGGDHDHIPAGEKGCSCRQPHLLDLGIDQGILFYVLVLGGDVGLRLVVIIVGDEILHPIFRKELPELIVELGGQGFVVGYDQSGTLQLLNDIGHGVGLSRAGHAQESMKVVLLPVICQEPGCQLLYGLGLGAGGLKRGDQAELLPGG